MGLLGPTVSAEPLKTLDDWRRNAHRPVIIVGNGPSANQLDPRRFPDNPLIIRMNAFFFERDYVFGDRVDGFFWAVARRWLQVGIGVAQRRGDYDFGTFFSPTDVERDTLYAFRGEASRLAEELSPRTSHFQLFHADPILKSWFSPRKERKRAGLPTQGMQALAAMLCLGFRDIHVTGIDFYQAAGSRYAFPYPDFVKEMTAPVHLNPGYEGQYHSINLDIEFFHTLRKSFRDAEIYSLSEHSFFSKIASLSPIIRNDKQLSGSKRDKDNDGFLGQMKSDLQAAFVSDDPLRGEVAKLGTDKLLIWAWDPANPSVRHSVNLLVDGRHVETIAIDKFIFELETGCIGDAKHGYVMSIAAIEARHGPGTIEFRHSRGGRLLANGRIAEFGSIRRNRPALGEVLIRGFLNNVADETAILSRREPIDTVIHLAGNADTVVHAREGLLNDFRAHWEIAAHVSAELGEQCEIELAAAMWAISTFPGQAVRLLGYQSFTSPQLLTLARQLPELAQALLDAFLNEDLSTLSANAGPILKALQMMLSPLIVITDQVGAMSGGRLAELSDSHAILQALPRAFRVTIGVWSIGLGDVLTEQPANSNVLIDDAALLNASNLEFSTLLNEMKALAANIFVSISSLPVLHSADPKAAQLRERIEKLHGLNAGFLSASSDVRRAMMQIYGAPSSAIVPLATQKQWTAGQIEPKPRLRCAVLVSSLAPDQLRELRMALWELDPKERRRLKFDVIPASLIGQREAGTAEGEALTTGVGLADATDLAAYDLAIIATSDLGQPLAAKLAYAANIPTLSTEDSGMAELLPREAIRASLRHAVTNAATVLGQTVLAGLPVRPASEKVEQEAAALLEVIFPGAARDGAAALPFGAEGRTKPARALDGKDLALAKRLQLAVVAALADRDQASLRILISNGSDQWLPMGQEDGQGIVVEATIRLGDGLKAPVMAAQRLSCDLAPGASAIVGIAVGGASENFHLSAKVVLDRHHVLLSKDFGRFNVMDEHNV